MQTKKIESVEDLLAIVQEFANTTVVNRGVTSSDYELVPYELVPKVGRRRRGKKALETKDAQLAVYSLP